MIQIRIHGRGGQGVVTSAELIAIAAFKAGKEAQAFPSFGVERTGAPVEAYARIDTKPIRIREQIYHPDIIMVQDETLIGAVDVTKGHDLRTKIIVNSGKTPQEIAQKLNIPVKNIYTFDATKLALQIFKKNITNTLMLAAFAKITGMISLDELRHAIIEKFGEKGEEIIKKNILSIEKAYQSIQD
jgi:2-oxoacid:acceptor oxidoreductase gamma subunit (pyruvate/2-ketoisovalerate family)